jgi:dTDP-4-dehydrorhamnose reductase
MGDMKIVVFGAGGIIGQTMRLVQPTGHEIIYYRRHADFVHRGLDLTDWRAAEIALNFERPDVIVNLAGENRPDVVEQHPGEYKTINVQTPSRLGWWCDAHSAQYIHISSQAVFAGDYVPYSPDSELQPINEYGRQKAEAERLVQHGRNWTIIRPTFVLGIRPLPHIGRQNPLEQMLANPNGKQVNDRWFSPICAKELATVIWEQVLGRTTGIVHAGRPVTASRHSIAGIVGGNPEPVAHSHFQCAAERAFDTTYEKGALHDQTMTLEEALMDAVGSSKAEDIALFLGLSLQEADQRLSSGFGVLHGEVTEDFHAIPVSTDAELLDWYSHTESYIWELTAYHLDPGFNYEGICDGIVQRLGHADGEILCVGDGVGQLTLRLR